MEIFYVIYILIFIVFCLALYSIVQLKTIGINVKDFWSFIQANQILDKLYIFSKKYERLNTMEQLIFLKEAEEVFKAFEKVPNVLWEEEFPKYDAVLSTYRDIKVLRWVS